MNDLRTLLSSAPSQISPSLLILNIFFSAFFSLILGRFYTHFGQSLSNRSRLARNFTLVSVTTALVITIVKSSLALSLGLVGALSIVRFRAAIKEPEDLGYLFLSITLGLGFGANQSSITIISFLLILAILYLQHLFHPLDHKENLFINLKLKKKDQTNLKNLIDHLSRHTAKLDLRRVEDTQTELNLGCLVEFKNPQQLQNLLDLTRKKYPKIHLLLVDSFV